MISVSTDCMTKLFNTGKLLPPTDSPTHRMLQNLSWCLTIAIQPTILVVAAIVSVLGPPMEILRGINVVPAM